MCQTWLLNLYQHWKMSYYWRLGQRVDQFLLCRIYQYCNLWKEDGIRLLSYHLCSQVSWFYPFLIDLRLGFVYFQSMQFWTFLCQGIALLMFWFSWVISFGLNCRKESIQKSFHRLVLQLPTNQPFYHVLNDLPFLGLDIRVYHSMSLLLLQSHLTF